MRLQRLKKFFLKSPFSGKSRWTISGECMEGGPVVVKSIIWVMATVEENLILTLILK